MSRYATIRRHWRGLSSAHDGSAILILTMLRPTAIRTTLFHSLLSLALMCICTVPAFAQEAGDLDVIKSQIDQFQGEATQQERPTEEALKEPLGIVQEIRITGLPSVKRSVIQRQLTFKAGDTFSEWHRWRSVRRLYELGLFWDVRVDYEVIGEEVAPTEDASAETSDTSAPESVDTPADSEEPTDESMQTDEVVTSEAAPEPEPALAEPIDPTRPLRIIVTVLQGKSYYIYPYGISESPYLIGAVAGDRDFFGSGKNVSGMVFSIDELRYYALIYEDPQFLGGHQRASTTIQWSDSVLDIRDEVNPSTGESYYLGKDGFNFEYRTSAEDRYVVTWGLEAYNIETDLRFGTLIGGTKQFLLSGTEIPEGTLTYFKGGIAENKIKGYPLTNGGYYWSANTSQSLEALGSLETFGKYAFTVAGFYPIGEGHALGARLRMDTTTGDIPHYERPLAGPTIRGYTGTDFYAKSTLILNTEFRYMVDPDWGQAVVFFDLGKGFDSRMPKLEDLEYGYGAGVRVKTGKWLPIDVVLYADYGIGPDDYEINVGIGQWF